MQDKIIANFKAKFPAVNLRKKRLDDIAAKLSAKITDEAEIDTKLDELNEIFPFAEIAKQDDAFYEMKKKANEKPASDSPNQSTTTTNNDVPDDTPAWAKTLVESNRTLAEKLAAFEKEKTMTSIQQKIAGHEKLKGIPSVFYKGRALPENEEALETFVDGIKQDFDSFKQESNNEGLLNSTKPAGSTGQPSKVSSEFEEIMNERRQQRQQTEAATK